MSAIDDKYHLKIDGYGFVLAVMPRGDRHIYGREEAPSFVNKFGSGDPNYRDSTFFPHFVQNNWLNGFDQEKFSDGGRFFRSSKLDTTEQEKLMLEKAVTSSGTITGQTVAFGQRSSSSQGWYNTNYQYRQQITVTAPVANAVPVGYPVKVTIDTAALQTAGKLLANRNDWRIIYNNGTTSADLSRDYVTTTATYFPIQTTISAGQTDGNYYVYYGYSSESTNKQPTTEAEWNGVYGFYGTTPDANSVALYHFREGTGTSVADDSASTNTGSASGTPSWGTDGKFGRYLGYVTASSQYVDLGTSSSFDLGSMTLEGWFYFTVDPSGQTMALVSSWGLSDPDKSFKMRVVGGKLALSIYSGVASDEVIGATTLSQNTWYHLAATYDGSNTGVVYVNGTQDATKNMGLSVNPTNIATYIGQTGDSGERSYLAGRTQHLRVSNIVRSSFPYAMASEPSVTPDTEVLQASVSASGTFEIYSATSDGNIYLWDGTSSWGSPVFNVRRLQWFDTVATKDIDHVLGDTAGTETAQAQSFQLATDSKIKAVQFYIKKDTGTPTDITVRIETDSSSAPSGSLANANLTTTVTAFTTGTYAFVTAEFPSASSSNLTASTVYWLVLKTAAASNDNYYTVGADASSPGYASGNMAHSTDGGTTWSADSGDDMFFRVLGEDAQANQIAQATFSGTAKLYFAVGDPTSTSPNNAKVFSFDGTTWVLVKTFTGTGSSSALCLQSYNGKLYVGLAPTAQIYVTSDGTTFTLSKDIDEPGNPGYVWDMEVYNGRLYACGGHPEYVVTNNSQGFLWSFDEFTWTLVYDFSFTVIKCLRVYDNLLFLGSVDKKLFVYNTASMDKLLELPWDLSVNSMEVYDDKLAIGLGPTNSLTGEEGVYVFDRNGFHKAFVPGAVGINALFVARNQLLIGTTDTTIYKASSTVYAASGTMQLSYFEASLPSIDKSWRSIIVHYEELPAGGSILLEYKTDESDAAWTTIGTADNVGTTSEEFIFDVDFYSRKISLRLTLSTSDTSVTPVVTVVDVKYIVFPDFKYLWKMKLACPDNIMWLDGTRPITTNTTAITLAQTTLPLTDASGFPTKGRAVVVDAGVEDEFTWTGKSTNTLTGVSGLLAHTDTGLIVKMTAATMHKQILTLKQTKQYYTLTDIDGLEYTIHFNNYQAQDFVVNQTDGIENNVPITLLEA